MSMLYNIRSGAIRWQIPDFLSDDNSNVCSIYHHLQFKKIVNNCDLEKEDQGQRVEERDLRHSIGNVRVRWFFRIIATWQSKLTQKVRHTHLHTQR